MPKMLTANYAKCIVAVGGLISVWWYGRCTFYFSFIVSFMSFSPVVCVDPLEMFVSPKRPTPQIRPLKWEKMPSLLTKTQKKPYYDASKEKQPISIQSFLVKREKKPSKPTKIHGIGLEYKILCIGNSFVISSMFLCVVLMSVFYTSNM